MKKTILLLLVVFIISGMFSCELADVYRPTEVEATNILKSVQDIFLPVAYKEGQIIEPDTKSKMITPIEKESDNGLFIEGDIKNGDDAPDHLSIVEITLTATELEIELDDITYLDGTISFVIQISKEETAVINYTGELTITFKGNKLQFVLDISSELDMEKNTMTARGTYQIRDRKYDYSYNGDGPLED